jgi:hypothetical protein
MLMHILHILFAHFLKVSGFSSPDVAPVKIIQLCSLHIDLGIIGYVYNNVHTVEMCIENTTPVS